MGFNCRGDIVVENIRGDADHALGRIFNHFNISIRLFADNRFSITLFGWMHNRTDGLIGNLAIKG
jgi:hypothetical protein